MIYHHLFKKYGRNKTVNAALIGSGAYGTAIVAQQGPTPWLKVLLVADVQKEKAYESLLQAGLDPSELVYSDSAAQAAASIEQGKYVYTDRAQLAFEVECIDIVCESTGVAEAAAIYASQAIENGKSVAMITKGCDTVIGPLLRQKAIKNGVVYTPVDGDQHGLLMGLVEWAKLVGLEIICAGKATDGELIFDEKDDSIIIKTDKVIKPPFFSQVKIAKAFRPFFEPIISGRVAEFLEQRQLALQNIPTYGSYDLSEMLLAANATGFSPSLAPLIHGILRISEIPSAYCLKKNGGLLDQNSVIDMVCCLRRPEEAGLGGGVFLVVRCANAYAQKVLATKGQITNFDGSAALIYRPYHLCGVESSISLLSAVLLGVDTGCGQARQTYDVVRVAQYDLKAGQIIGGDHDPAYRSQIIPAVPISPDNPAAAHLASGNPLKADISAGTVLTYDMIEEPKDSALWALRRELDQQLG